MTKDELVKLASEYNKLLVELNPCKLEEKTTGVSIKCPTVDVATSLCQRLNDAMNANRELVLAIEIFDAAAHTVAANATASYWFKREPCEVDLIFASTTHTWRLYAYSRDIINSEIVKYNAERESAFHQKRLECLNLNNKV